MTLLRSAGPAGHHPGEAWQGKDGDIMGDDIPRVPTSWGELLDKITILEVKALRLATIEARANAGKELAMLREIAAPVLPHPEIAPMAIRLKALNEALWDIEDRIREHERTGDF